MPLPRTLPAHLSTPQPYDLDTVASFPNLLFFATHSIFRQTHKEPCHDSPIKTFIRRMLDYILENRAD